MGKQFNIRSDEAHALAVDLSTRLGKPLSTVVEEALRDFDRKQRALLSEEELWGPLLAETQARVRAANCTFEVEDLYDPETGLPG